MDHNVKQSRYLKLIITAIVLGIWGPQRNTCGYPKQNQISDQKKVWKVKKKNHMLNKCEISEEQ